MRPDPDPIAEHYRSALEAIRGDDGACARWLAARGVDSQSAGDLARQEYERGAGPIGTLRARYAELLDRAIACRTVALVALSAPPAPVAAGTTREDVLDDFVFWVAITAAPIPELMRSRARRLAGLSPAAPEVEG